MDLLPWEETVEEERFPLSGNPFHCLEGPLGQIGSWSGLNLA